MLAEKNRIAPAGVPALARQGMAAQRTVVKKCQTPFAEVFQKWCLSFSASSLRVSA